MRNAADRPVALPGEPAVAGLEVVVVVPGLAVAVPELDEADPALEQPPGDQELPGVHAGPYSSRIDSGSWLMSKASAASVCIR